MQKTKSVSDPLSREVNGPVVGRVEAAFAVAVLDGDADVDLVAALQPRQDDDGGGGKEVVVAAA